METEVETPSPKNSPFTFDCWQCLACHWAMSDTAYSASRLDYDCPNCGAMKLSDFQLRKAKRSED